MKRFSEMINEAVENKGMTVDDLIKHLQKNFANGDRIFIGDGEEDKKRRPLFAEDITKLDDKRILFKSEY